MENASGERSGGTEYGERIRRLKPLSGGGRLRFYRATPVRGGAWGDAYNTLPVHTETYLFLFWRLFVAYRGLTWRSSRGSSRAQRFEESGGPIERIVEHGLERVPQAGIRHELGVT